LIAEKLSKDGEENNSCSINVTLMTKLEKVKWEAENMIIVGTYGEMTERRLKETECYDEENLTAILALGKGNTFCCRYYIPLLVEVLCYKLGR
jgi:hypothetical protein